MTAAEATFEELRPLLFSIAYRMLASASEAEDLVQDTWLRYEAALRDGVRIESPKAYLSAIVTRLAINELKSARKRRERYVGEWLPEPIVTDDVGPETLVEETESLSMAFLLLLDRLSPLERAVFLLHDVFDYDFAEVARIIGKTEPNSRQLAVRARRRIKEGRPRFGGRREERRAVAQRFFAALRAGNVEDLVRLLAPDVVVFGDGGGKAPQWSQPIAGIDRVRALLVGLARQMNEFGVGIEPRDINGEPGAILRDRQGLIAFVWALDIHDGRIHRLRSVINPDKLRHLGPVADVRAELRAARGGPPD